MVLATEHMLGKGDVLSALPKFYISNMACASCVVEGTVDVAGSPAVG